MAAIKTVSSKSLRKLNTVDIYYYDSKVNPPKPNALFSSVGTPLYLVGEPPQIGLTSKASSLWGSSKMLNNPTARAVIQGVTSHIPSDGPLGFLSGLSGAIDLREKFAFEGSDPISFNVNCVLLNTEGWEKSIQPALNAIANWILPSDHKMPGTNEDYVAGETFISELSKEGDSLTGDKKTAFEYLIKGLNAIKDWIGDIKVLELPEQYSKLEARQMHACIKIGRVLIQDIYIESVGINIPRTVMVNESGDPEPDRVNLAFNFKTLRQTTTSMISF